MRIAGVGKALPPNYYDQDTLLAALKAYWSHTGHNVERLESLHRRVAVGGRYLALTLEEFPRLKNWGEANDAWIRVAQDLGGQALTNALRAAGFGPAEVGAIFFVTVTGIATPSIDARLVGKVGLSPRVRRLPIFGLGCVAGAAGIARAADYVRAYPDQLAVLLSVELCSLTIQRGDLSVANLIATGLFGDGAAAVVIAGEKRPVDGPRIVDSRSTLYPDTEDVMGWAVTERGFKIVLSADVPKVVRQHLREDVDAFLADHGLARRDIVSWVCHPGGPKVLEAFQEALELPPGALDVTWRSLTEVGNLSSTSVLFVLADVMEHHRPPRGSPGMLLALGPGFCSELVLLEW